MNKKFVYQVGNNKKVMTGWRLYFIRVCATFTVTLCDIILYQSMCNINSDTVRPYTLSEYVQH